MSLNFSPNYIVTLKIVNALLKIERIKGLPITPTVLASLRESEWRWSKNHATMVNELNSFYKSYKKNFKV